MPRAKGTARVRRDMVEGFGMAGGQLAVMEQWRRSCAVGRPLRGVDVR